MNAEELYKQVSQQLSSTLAGAQAINDEIHGHLRSAMISTFSKLDLVTREEFDAQRAVLMRSREKKLMPSKSNSPSSKHPSPINNPQRHIQLSARVILIP